MISNNIDFDALQQTLQALLHNTAEMPEESSVIACICTMH